MCCPSILPSKPFFQKLLIAKLLHEERPPFVQTVPFSLPKFIADSPAVLAKMAASLEEKLERIRNSPKLQSQQQVSPWGHSHSGNFILTAKRHI
jgi:hypothetical protein